jgi:hypothetical protein
VGAVVRGARGYSRWREQQVRVTLKMLFKSKCAPGDGLSNGGIFVAWRCKLAVIWAILWIFDFFVFFGDGGVFVRGARGYSRWREQQVRATLKMLFKSKCAPGDGLSNGADFVARGWMLAEKWAFLWFGLNFFFSFGSGGVFVRVLKMARAAGKMEQVDVFGVKMCGWTRAIEWCEFYSLAMDIGAVVVGYTIFLAFFIYTFFLSLFPCQLRLFQTQIASLEYDFYTKRCSVSGAIFSCKIRRKRIVFDSTGGILVQKKPTTKKKKKNTTIYIKNPFLY